MKKGKIYAGGTAAMVESCLGVEAQDVLPLAGFLAAALDFGEAQSPSKPRLACCPLRGCTCDLHSSLRRGAKRRSCS